MTIRIAIEPEDWLEKRFSFDYPTGAFPAVVERLRGTPARIEELVGAFPAEILGLRAGDSWSIKEHTGHLYDLEEVHEGRLDDYAAGLQTLRPADMTNRKTYEAGHNDKPLELLLEQFRETRMRFVERLEELDEAAVERSAVHPRLKRPMRVLDFALFTAEHDDHHLASITYVARVLREK